MGKVKRQTTVAIHTGVAADPGDDSVFIDGHQAELILDMQALNGTSVQADLVELLDGGISLDYDGQTANFTVGAKVTGYAFDGGPNATGVIVSDTDGGATGTLILKEVQGRFKDNMVLRDDNATQGVAVANGAGTEVKLVGGIWATLTSSGVGSQSVVLTNPDLAAGDGGLTIVSPREFAVQYTFTAVTSADFVVDIAQLM